MSASGPLNNNWESIIESRVDCIIRIKSSVAKYTGMGYLSRGNKENALGSKW